MEKKLDELIQEPKKLWKKDQSLEKSLSLYRNVVEMAPDAVLLGEMSEPYGVITMANKRAAVLSGYSREELIGMNISRLFSMTELKRVPLRYDLLRQGRTIMIERSLLRKDGTTVPVEMNSSMLPNGNFHTFIRDITDRQRSRQALIDSEERFRALHDASFGGICIHDWGVILDCNQGLSDMTGFSTDELIGMDGLELIAPDWRELMRQNVLGGFELPYRVDGLRKDGTRYPLRIQAKNIPYRGQNVRVMEFRDITEQQQLEEKLQESARLQTIGRLAGGIAHDFNNQLLGVIGFADMLISRIKDEKLRGYVFEIKRCAERSGDLIRQLLASSRGGKYQSVPVCLNRTLDEVMSVLNGSLDKRIQVRLFLNADPSVVLGDPTQLHNVFLNLAINARDAMPEGGELVLETAVTTLDKSWGDGRVDKIGPGKFIRISVTDNGCGMDEETLKHIFEPFFTTKEVGQGTGMGLAGVYDTVNNHKGVITAHSEVGRGTVFHIYLPLAEGAPGDQHGTATAPVTGSARILLVDDDDMVRDIATEMLRTLGYKVTGYKDGRKAVEYYRRSWKHVDLVILDMAMPEFDGMEIFVAMREVNPQIRAILSSGYSIKGKAQAILNEGAMGFVGKPYSLMQLSEEVAQVLNRTPGKGKISGASH